MSDTDTTLILARDLQPGDFLDFFEDPVVDQPDHCMICQEAIQWDSENEWTHVEPDGSHLVCEAPRDVGLEFEGVIVGTLLTAESFDTLAAEWGLHAAERPAPGVVVIWSTQDDWITLPATHECKLIERRGAEAAA